MIGDLIGGTDKGSDKSSDRYPGIIWVLGVGGLTFNTQLYCILRYLIGEMISPLIRDLICL